jgi:hypothetical protein
MDVLKKIEDYAVETDNKYLFDTIMWAQGKLKKEPQPEDYSTIDSPSGRFEELTKEEQAEIQDDGFNGFFKILCDHFDLKASYSKFDLQTIKNLTHHAWNANKKTDINE